MAKFSKQEILMGRVAETDLPVDQQRNLEALVERLNALFADYSGPIRVSSGYRRPADNSAAKGASKSWHMQAAAVDLADASGAVWAHCMDRLDACERLGLWLEDRASTPTWVHLQVKPPRSGKRVFKP